MRVTKDPETRRQEIIETAAELFEKKGIRKTSITEIAKTLCVAKGLVYYYFSSKDELVTAVIEQLAQSLDAALAEIVARDDLDFYSRLKAIFNFYFHAIQSHPRVLTVSPNDPAAFSLLRDRLSHIAFYHVHDVLNNGMKQNLITIKHPQHMLRILINGLGDLYINGVHDPKVHATLIEQTLNLEPGCLT
jgi:AcrR family transcriptional regulator